MVWRCSRSSMELPMKYSQACCFCHESSMLLHQHGEHVGQLQNRRAASFQCHHHLLVNGNNDYLPFSTNRTVVPETKLATRRRTVTPRPRIVQYVCTQSCGERAQRLASHCNLSPRASSPESPCADPSVDVVHGTEASASITGPLQASRRQKLQLQLRPRAGQTQKNKQHSILCTGFFCLRCCVTFGRLRLF
jgi:hypothetical protein